MTTVEQDLSQAVVDALHTVVDPCGMYNGSQTTIGDLGMYRGIVVTDDTVAIEVFLDDPSCAFAGQIILDIHRAVDPVVGGRKVEMSLVTDDFWDQDRITEAGRRKLEDNREVQRQRMLPLSVVPAHR